MPRINGMRTRSGRFSIGTARRGTQLSRLSANSSWCIGVTKAGGQTVSGWAEGRDHVVTDYGAKGGDGVGLVIRKVDRLWYIYILVNFGRKLSVTS